MGGRPVRRALCLSFAGAIAISLLFTSNNVATATTRVTSNARAQLLQEQQRLLDVSSRIHTSYRSHTNSGYAGVRIDPTEHSLDVYWHGAVPSDIIGALDSARTGGIVARLHKANFSFNDLEHAKQGMVASLVAAGVRFSTIGPRTDGTGLTLTLPDTDTAQATTARAIVARSNVPVVISTGGALQFDGRIDDIAPFFGGDFMQSNSADCTTGFAVQNSRAEQFLLTAAHCSPTGIDTWSTGAGLTIGSVAGWSGSDDAMIISTSSLGTIWTGTGIADPAHQTATSVNGAGDPTVGEVDCASGAFSGEVCGDKVVAVGQSIQICESSCVVVDNIAQAEQIQHLATSGSGDSGGPVFQVIGGDANARGTITAHDSTTDVPCAGVPTGNGRTCGWRFFFPDVLAELGAFGVNVMATG